MNVVRSALAHTIRKSYTVRMSSSGPMAATIRSKLTEALQPTHLEVINESHMHNVPENSETHFKVVIVSDKFEEEELKVPLARHRYVFNVLTEELTTGPVHALAIVARSPSQWDKQSSKKIDPSPSCRGGDGSLPRKNEAKF